MFDDDVSRKQGRSTTGGYGVVFRKGKPLVHDNYRQRRAATGIGTASRKRASHDNSDHIHPSGPGLITACAYLLCLSYRR